MNCKLFMYKHKKEGLTSFHFETIEKRSAPPQPPLMRGLASLRDWGRDSINKAFILSFCHSHIFSPSVIRSFLASDSSLIRGIQGQILFLDIQKGRTFVLPFNFLYSTN